MAKPTRSKPVSSLDEAKASEVSEAKALGEAEKRGLVQIKIERLQMVTMEFPIRGVTPLITHQWAEKAIREMEEKGGPATAKKVKEKRDSEGDYQAARYVLDVPRADSWTDGMPAVAFKAALVQGARAFENVTMTLLKQFIFVHGEPPQMLIPLEAKPKMRRDMVRVGKGLNKTADIRWRPEYWPWSALLRITWPTALFDIDSIASLVEAAGIGGVGEWRPTAPQSMTGVYGKFDIDTDRLILPT